MSDLTDLTDEAREYGERWRKARGKRAYNRDGQWEWWSELEHADDMQEYRLPPILYVATGTYFWVRRFHPTEQAANDALAAALDACRRACWVEGESTRHVEA